MVPFVSTVAEFEHQAKLIHSVAKDTMDDLRSQIQYEVGSMIETPRAALLAGTIAPSANFCWFGSNDLTQCAATLVMQVS